MLAAALGHSTPTSMRWPITASSSVSHYGNFPRNNSLFGVSPPVCSAFPVGAGGFGAGAGRSFPRGVRLGRPDRSGEYGWCARGSYVSGRVVRGDLCAGWRFGGSSFDPNVSLEAVGSKGCLFFKRFAFFVVCCVQRVRRTGPVDAHGTPVPFQEAEGFERNGTVG